MLWFWIVVGCVVVVLLALLEFRAEKKPEMLRRRASGDESIKWPSGGGGG